MPPGRVIDPRLNATKSDLLPPQFGFKDFGLVWDDESGHMFPFLKGTNSLDLSNGTAVNFVFEEIEVIVNGVPLKLDIALITEVLTDPEDQPVTTELNLKLKSLISERRVKKADGSVVDPDNYPDIKPDGNDISYPEKKN